MNVARISLLSFLLAGFGVLVTPRRILRNAWARIVATGRWLGEDARSQRMTAFVLIWMVALVPMVHVSWVVRHYAVEVPTLDDWEMAPLIVDAHTGHLNWADIFAQQQEARTVLPKLIFILSAADGHWDVRDQMMLSLISCWLTAIGIFILLRRSGLHPAAMALSFWLAVLTIFTFAQYELWIFASGFPSFLPALFLVASLVILGTDRLATAWKFVFCGILATASSFTLPHGLLAWGLTFPALLLMRRIPRWSSWLAAWVGLCALCAVTYFWSYRKPVNLPQFAPVVSWTDYMQFILQFLGGGLAYAWKANPGLCAAVFAASKLTFFLLAVVYCFRRMRDRVLIARVTPWFALGLYSIASAILAALGRVGYGVRYSLASRYVTFSLCLTVAVIALIALVVREIILTRDVRARRWAIAFCAIVAAAYLVPFKAAAFNTRFFLRGLSRNDRLGRAAVLFFPVIDTSDVIKKTIYPSDARLVTNSAEALDRLKLLRPSLVRSNRIEAIPHQPADDRQASGSCESITTTDGEVRATGWATLNAKGRPADAVAVAYQVPPNDEWILGGLSDSFVLRPEIMKRLGTIEQVWSGWSVTLPQSAFPPDAKLSFWAVDADEPRLYRLKDESKGANIR